MPSQHCDKSIMNEKKEKEKKRQKVGDKPWGDGIAAEVRRDHRVAFEAHKRNMAIIEKVGVISAS